MEFEGLVFIDTGFIMACSDLRGAHLCSKLITYL